MMCAKGDTFESVKREQLKGLIKRRDLLNESIETLTYDLEHPQTPIQIDQEKIDSAVAELERALNGPK